MRLLEQHGVQTRVHKLTHTLRWKIGLNRMLLSRTTELRTPERCDRHVGRYLLICLNQCVKVQVPRCLHQNPGSPQACHLLAFLRKLK